MPCGESLYSGGTPKPRRNCQYLYSRDALPLTGVADQDVDVINVLLDLLRGCFHVLDICQIAGYELHTVVVHTERQPLAIPPFFASSIELILGSGQDKDFRYAM